MTNNCKNGRYLLFAALGAALLAAGFLLMKAAPGGERLPNALPYLCVGIGTGVFGQNLGELMRNLAVKSDPRAAKQIEIEVKDERNVAIGNRAKAKAYDLMLMVFGALLLTFALMQVQLSVILISVAAYLFIVFSQVFYGWKYRKEM